MEKVSRVMLLCTCFVNWGKAWKECPLVVREESVTKLTIRTGEYMGTLSMENVIVITHKPACCSSLFKVVVGDLVQGKIFHLIYMSSFHSSLRQCEHLRRHITVPTACQHDVLFVSLFLSWGWVCNTEKTRYFGN